MLYSPCALLCIYQHEFFFLPSHSVLSDNPADYLFFYDSEKFFIIVSSCQAILRPFPTLFSNTLSSTIYGTSFCDIQTLIPCHSKKLSFILLKIFDNIPPMIALFRSFNKDC